MGIVDVHLAAEGFDVKLAQAVTVCTRHFGTPVTGGRRTAVAAGRTRLPRGHNAFPGKKEFAVAIDLPAGSGSEIGRPAAQRRDGVAAHGALEPPGDRLAVRGLAIGDRLAPGHDHVDRAARHQPGQMRPQRRPAIPGDPVSRVAVERQAEQPGIGDRERLEPYLLDVLGFGERIARRADQRGAEGEHAVAVARGALAEQHARDRRR